MTQPSPTSTHLSRSLFALLALLLPASCNTERPPSQSLPKHAPAVTSAEPKGEALVLHPLDPARESSILVAARAGGADMLLLADEDGRRVVAVDLHTGNVAHQVSTECPPGHVLIHPRGFANVTLPSCGKVLQLELTTAGFVTAASTAVGVEPTAMALDEARGTLMVVDTWGRALHGFDATNMKHRFSVPVARDPRAVSVIGGTALVTHGSGAVSSRLDVSTLRVHKEGVSARRFRGLRAPHRMQRMLHSQHDLFMLDTPPRRHIAERSAEVHLFATQAFSVTSNDDTFFVPQTLTDPGRPGSIATGYGSALDRFPKVVQDVAVVDAHSGQSNRAGESFAIIDGWKTQERNLCLLPRAARYDATRDSLLVACAGSSRVVELDGLARDPARTELTEWRLAAEPVALTVIPSQRRAVTFHRGQRSFSVLQLSEGPRVPVREYTPAWDALMKKPVPSGAVDATFVLRAPTERSQEFVMGRALFHSTGDARISEDGRACASCHPDARDDGLTWRAPGALRGRQTMMLAGRVEGTAPYGWLGEHATLAEHVAHTISRQLRGQGLDEKGMNALLHYVTHAPAPPRGKPGGTATAARWGKQLFHSKDIGCNDCHRANGKVDGEQHGDLDDGDDPALAARDTPSLRFLDGTAPFFHDGRFATLEEMLVATAGHMGQRRPLDAKERSALVEYLQTL